MPYAYAAKAIASFVVSYALILLSPLGITGEMTLEEVITTVVSALFVSISTAISVYMAKNKV